MGAALETLQVALGAGGAATVLATSVSVWLKTRRPSVSLRVRRRDGSELEIDATVEDVDSVVRHFVEAASEPE